MSALVRVFEMPQEFAKGFLFSGPRAATFMEVDWFRDEDGNPSFATEEGRTAVAEFLRVKNYFRRDRAYLVLHPQHSFTIDYEAP